MKPSIYTLPHTVRENLMTLTCVSHASHRLKINVSTLGRRESCADLHTGGPWTLMETQCHAGPT